MRLVTDAERELTPPVDDVGVGPWAGPWPEDPRYDPELLAHGDRRNVADRYRYWTVEAVVADLDTRRHPFHVAIENWKHDLNIGTVVRTANAFLAAGVHVVGNRRWNRRGAMVTDRYLHVHHSPDVAALAAWARGEGLPLLAVDNLPGRPAAGDRAAAAGLRAAVRPGGHRAERRRPRPGRRRAVDRPVRLDPVDQRRGRGRHRDARLDPAARRPAAGVTSGVTAAAAAGEAAPMSRLADVDLSLRLGKKEAKEQLAEAQDRLVRLRLRLGGQVGGGARPAAVRAVRGLGRLRQGRRRSSGW